MRRKISPLNMFMIVVKIENCISFNAFVDFRYTLKIFLRFFINNLNSFGNTYKNGIISLSQNWILHHMTKHTFDVSKAYFTIIEN